MDKDNILTPAYRLGIYWCMSTNNLIIKGVQDQIDNYLELVPSYVFFRSVSKSIQDTKKKRAEELIEIMKENEQHFIIELINNECFISGLALIFRQVIEQYSEYKRSRIYSIFLEFTDSEDKESFELEKMYNTLNLLSINDLEVLKTCNDSEFIETFVPAKSLNKRKLESLVSLSSAGLFYSKTQQDEGLHFIMTEFGKKFRQYVFN